jgi:hypothetical protein
MTITAPLTWEVFVAPAELTVTDDLPPARSIGPGHPSPRHSLWASITRCSSTR